MNISTKSIQRLRKSQRNQARKKIREDIRALEKVFGIDIDYSKGGGRARSRYRKSPHTGTYRAQSGDYVTALLSPTTWRKILIHKMKKDKIPAPLIEQRLEDGSRVSLELKKIRGAIMAIVALREQEAVGIVVDAKTVLESIATSQGFSVKEMAQ